MPEVRPYSFLVHQPNNFPALPVLLEDTYKLYNHGAAVCSDVLLNMLAGYNPSLCELPLFEDDDSHVSKPIFTFLSWFTLESKLSKQVLASTDPDKLVLQFKSYYKSVLSPEDLADISLIAHFGHRENAVWVDRRKSYLDWNKSIGLDDDVIMSFLLDSKVPLHKEGADSQSAFRSLLSKWWGSGEMENNDELGRICQKWTRIDLTKFIGAKCSDVTRELYRAVGCNSYADLNAKVGFKGRTKGIVMFLEGDGTEAFTEQMADKQTANIQKTLRDSEGNKRLGMCKGKPCIGRLMKYLESKIGIPYEEEKCVRQNQFGEMLSQAWQRIAPWRSGVINQFVKRKEYVGIKQGLAAFPTKFDNFVDDYFTARHKEIGGEKPYLSHWRLVELKTVLKHWRKDSNYLEGVRKVQESTEKRMDANLFNHLATKAKKILEMTDDEIKNGFGLLASHHEVDDALRHLMMPVFTHISSSNPIHPQFGESRPSGGIKMTDAVQRKRFNEDNKVILDKVRAIMATDDSLAMKYRKMDAINLVFKVQIELYNAKHKEFQLVDLPISGKRALVELFLGQEDKPDVIRNHPLSQIDGAMGNCQHVQGGFKLITKGEVSWKTGKKRWHLIFSPSFETPKTISAKDKFPVGLRVMGINNGQHQLIGYSIWEIAAGAGKGVFPVYSRPEKDENGNPLKGTKKVLCHARLLQTGVVDEEILGEDTPFDEDKKLKAFWKSLPRRKQGEQWTKGVAQLPHYEPTTTGHCLSLLADHARRYCGMAKVPTVKDRTVLLSIIKQFMEGRQKVGGLSSRRILTMNDIKRACGSYLHNLSKRGAQDEEIASLQEMFQTRLKNMKRERGRITANKCIDIANRMGVKLLVSEDLSDMKMSKGNQKSMNRCLGQWRPQEVLKQIKMQTKFNGIFYIAVVAGGVSSWDFATDEWQTRLSKIEKKDSKWFECGRWYKTFVRLGKLLKNEDDLGKYMEALREKLLKIGVKEAELLKPENIVSRLQQYTTKHGVIYLPSVDGRFFPCSEFGEPMDADIHASINVAFRGLRYRAGIGKPKAATMPSAARES